MEEYQNCREVPQTSKSTKNKKKTQKFYATGNEDVPFPF